MFVLLNVLFSLVSTDPNRYRPIRTGWFIQDGNRHRSPNDATGTRRCIELNQCSCLVCCENIWTETQRTRPNRIPTFVIRFFQRIPLVEFASNKPKCIIVIVGTTRFGHADLAKWFVASIFGSANCFIDCVGFVFVRWKFFCFKNKFIYGDERRELTIYINIPPQGAEAFFPLLDGSRWGTLGFCSCSGA